MTDANQRYQRQQQVPQLGPQSQDKLSAAHVLIVGAGGLGSPVSLFLAGAGVGTLTIVDADTVSLSNLHRQILFQESDINQAKVDAAQTRLHSLNSQIEINAIEQALSIDNATALVEQATVVVDAADNFLVSYLLSDLCFAKRIPLISASVLSTHGYLGVFCGTAEQPAPSLRAIFPTPSNTVANCNTAGVTGPSVGIIGSYQAQETLKVILQDPSQLLGKLMNLELWDYRQTIIDFNGAPEPQNQAELVSLHSLSNQDLLLDVRTPEEVQENPVMSVPSTVDVINIPLHLLSEQHQTLPQGKRLVCVCRSGQRALNAAQWLLDNGHPNSAVSSQ